MNIIRTIAWTALTIALVLFAVANWQAVEVFLWSGVVLETKLSVLVIAAFLLGLVPMWLIHRAAVWSWQRRLAAATPQSGPQSGPQAPAPSQVPPAVTVTRIEP